jgi:hypothetical protein
MPRPINSIVFAPPFQSGGVKSLYSVCEWLREFGRSTIVPFQEHKLAPWFDHKCQLYDQSYIPDVLVYPEVYQPHLPGAFHICFALGQHGLVQSHANLTICRSVEVLNWVNAHNPALTAAVILPSINRSIFEYDGRPKREFICYMTRYHKHPETARRLRRKYGDMLVEIANCSEAEVADILKSAKVFVWRGDDKEGSPRPPKEALVAGCVVVGLESDLTAKYHIDFGIKCSSPRKLIRTAGQALEMPVPTFEQRSVVRDSVDEKRDWVELFEDLRLSGLESASSQSLLRSKS